MQSSSLHVLLSGFPSRAPQPDGDPEGGARMRKLPSALVMKLVFWVSARMRKLALEKEVRADAQTV